MSCQAADSSHEDSAWGKLACAGRASVDAVLHAAEQALRSPVS